MTLTKLFRKAYDQNVFKNGTKEELIRSLVRIVYNKNYRGKKK